ncbi:MAG: hypothetical protein OXH51_08615 [Gemmatimonadetes bacterium]|nr:hypothetical protein [Gemmatimonadota bacterium]
MRIMRAMAAVAAFGACGLFQDTQLEVLAGDPGTPPVHDAEWPIGSGRQVTVNNALTDSVGLAGLEVEVFLPGGPDLVIHASDFDGVTYGPVSVENSGEARIFARLRRHGAPVAEGSISWKLADRRNWQVMIVRHAHPGYADEQLNCGALCVDIARFPIDDAARNYPDEYLWLVIRHGDGWEG